MEQTEYVALIKQEHSSAFYELVRPHKMQMYKIAYSYLGSEQDALEAIQETTCRAYNNFHKLKQPQYFKTWLIRILINYCIDELKRRKKSSIFIENIHIDEEDAWDERIQVKQALEKLKPRSKSIIILKYFEDLTINEIASILQKPTGTVKTWLNRALKELKITLGEEGAPNVRCTRKSTKQPEI